MKQEWEPDELIESWTPMEADWRLIGNESGATRLGFAVLLKFYEIAGRFPTCAEEVPGAAVGYLADLVKVEPAQFGKYAWSGSTIEYHRSQIRAAFGTRPASEEDEARWAVWLAGEVCPVETRRERLADALVRRCRSEKIEPPAEGQIERTVGSALRRHEEAFAGETVAKLGPGVCARLTELLDADGLLAELKADPGPLGLDTLFAELGKLGTVKALGLPDDLFADTSDRLVAAWRARAARMYPSDFRACSPNVRATLLAALCWVRQTEITDGLVELLARYTESRASPGRPSGSAHISSVHLCGSRICGVLAQLWARKSRSTPRFQRQAEHRPARLQRGRVEPDAEFLGDLPDRAGGRGLPEVDVPAPATPPARCSVPASTEAPAVEGTFLRRRPPTGPATASRPVSRSTSTNSATPTPPTRLPSRRAVRRPPPPVRIFAIDLVHELVRTGRA